MSEYIDREAALESVREKLLISESLPDTIAKSASVFTLASMNDSLKSIPAADVRPVVKAKWVEHYEPYSTGEEWVEAQYGYECSICGRWEYEKEPFCNCGADMREES